MTGAVLSLTALPLLALCIAVVLKRTTFGVAIEIVGHNPTSARYAGINIKRMIMTGDSATEWNLVMATAMLALLPPALVVILMQKWFVKGLVETEK